MAWTSFFSGASGDSRKEGVQNPSGGRRPKTSAVVTFDSAMSVSAYWASARLLTEVVAAMPIKCYDLDPISGIKKINVENELWKLINFRPNSFQTRTEFIESIMLAIVTRGNAYCSIERLRGRIIALTPLITSQMKTVLTNGQIHYEYTDSKGNVKVFAAKNIWHIKIFGNGIVGMSVLSYAARSLGIAISADERVSDLAATGGKATGILTVDKALTNEQRKHVKENFSELEEGDAQGLFVLEAGFAYQQTSLSPADMQLLENRRFQTEDIARFMGVPSVLINDTSATTTWGSGIEQIMGGFFKLNLRPHLERIESSVIRWLIDPIEWGTISIEFDFDSLLRADKATRLDAQAKAVNAGLLKPDEGRAEEGLPPATGGDKIYLNGTLVPAGTRLNANEITGANNAT